MNLITQNIRAFSPPRYWTFIGMEKGKKKKKRSFGFCTYTIHVYIIMYLYIMLIVHVSFFGVILQWCFTFSLNNFHFGCNFKV